MILFTVVWDPDAEDALTRLWLENPQMRDEIASAGDRIDELLKTRPVELGIRTSPKVREYVEPPLRVLFKVSEPDRLVRVLYVKFWTD
jgi:hypothetical protein